MRSTRTKEQGGVKTKAVTNIGNSHQDGHRADGKNKKKAKVGRELQVGTATRTPTMHDDMMIYRREIASI